MSGVRPLNAVLDAFEGGASTIDDIVTSTGMPRDVVLAAVDHLRRMGRLEARELVAGCPSGGCGSCAFSHGDGTPGCGAPSASPERRGPVLVQLSLRR